MTLTCPDCHSDFEYVPKAQNMKKYCDGCLKARRKARDDRRRARIRFQKGPTVDMKDKTPMIMPLDRPRMALAVKTRGWTEQHRAAFMASHRWTLDGFVPVHL